MDKPKFATLTLGEAGPLPVIGGTEGPQAIDVRSLYADQGLLTFDPGYRSTASCKSAITYIDGTAGVLRHRRGAARCAPTSRWAGRSDRGSLRPTRGRRSRGASRRRTRERARARRARDAPRDSDAPPWCPGARAVASLTMDREAMRLRDSLSTEYAALIYRGFWFSPEREALQKLIDHVNEPVTGTALRSQSSHTTPSGPVTRNASWERTSRTPAESCCGGASVTFSDL